jgi:hypothetical protein
MGCAKAAWVAHPNHIPPDRSCRVGGVESGSMIYVWDCVNNEHVVVSQFLNYFGAYRAKIEKVACGETTLTEKRDVLVQGGCEEVTPKFVWNAPVNRRGRIPR